MKNKPPVHRKHVPTPLTTKEIRKRIRQLIDKKGKDAFATSKQAAKININVDKRTQRNEIGNRPPKPEDFGHVDVAAIFYLPDTELVSGTGKVHKERGGMRVAFSWTVPGFGFGELTLHRFNDGTVEYDDDSGTLSPEFFKAMLCALIDKARPRKSSSW